MSRVLQLGLLKRKRYRFTALVAAVAAVAAFSGTAQAQPGSASASASASAAKKAPASVSSSPAGINQSVLASPQSVLAPGWKQSTDRAVTLSGDDNGLNVLVSDASSGYQWRTAATLSEPGADTTEWIGQDCLTSSGRQAVVVYAPREFTNDEQTFDQGAFVAVVDLVTGAVRKLPFTATLAYYNPGCGAGDQVTLTSLETVGNTTVSTVRLVDAATGKVLRQTDSPGELSSPVPYQGSVAAALGDRLVSINAKGAEHTLATDTGTPFRLHADASGGLAYQVPTSGNKVQVRRFASGKSTLLGTGTLGKVQLAASGTQVFLLGPDADKVPLTAKSPGGWKKLNAPVDSEVSTTGALAVTSSTNEIATTPKATAIPTQIAIKATVTSTDKAVSFDVEPAAINPKAGTAASPALSAIGGDGSNGSTASGSQSSATAKSGTAAKSSTTVKSGTAVKSDAVRAQTTSVDPATVPYDPDRGCAVARNDPTIQTYQATAQQVEWAVDLAVHGQLTASRAANWEGSGMPVSWTPQGMFPLQTINGGGTVPAQVVLGVLAQESNTLQASPHAVDAITGNFNQGGFYGNGSDWSTVDCGYGIGQVTTGMAMSTPAGTSVADGSMTYTTAEQQQAIATDYASNIAATVNMLIDKWNQLEAAGITLGDGNPKYIENWWFAVWAYNSGIEPGTAAFGNTTGCTPGPNCTDNGGSGGNWGLGWANNPANPAFPADRGTFTDSAADTKVPNHWTYPELVMGWAYSPVPRFNYATGEWGPAYAPATGEGQPDSPPLSFFCTAVDNCTPDAAPDANGTADSAGLCNAANDHCWWHTATSWVTCSTSSLCGTENLTYTSSSAKPLGTDIYPADCRALGTASGSTSSDSTGATPPTGSIVVDDTTVPSVASCDQTWTDQGSFNLQFNYAPPGCDGCSDPIDYPGKVDFHQLGVGFGGHIWFTHTEPTTDFADAVTGTWTPPALNGWTRVYVHIPDNGDTTQQAPYTITTGMSSGITQETRYVNTDLSTNEWVSLGVFQFSSANPQGISLTNSTPDGDGTQDIAFDSVAFQPLSAKPANVVVQMGDSYSSGEGAEPYTAGTDVGPYADQSSQTSPGETWNACRRSENSYIRKTVLPGQTSTIGTLADDNSSSLDFHDVACSGAYTTEVDQNIANNGQVPFGTIGEFHEMPQLESGYLDANTTLVTLTIGGNDIGFSNIVQGCAETSLGCPSTSSVENSINTQMPFISDVIQAIHAEAQNAKIYLLGYPDLFDSSNIDACTTTIMSPDSMSNLNSWGDYLTNAENTMATGLQQQAQPVPVTFVNPNAAFQGYEDCGSTANGINDFVAAPTGPGDFSCPVTVDPTSWICASMESFHPNNTGTSRYAVALESALG